MSLKKTLSIGRCLALTLLAGGVTMAACKGAPQGGAWCSDSIAPLSPVKTPLTWHKDIATIVQQKCSRCHDAGGIAPLTFDGFTSVFKERTIIRKVVTEQTMPPFLASTCCSAYTNDYSLTDDELNMIVGWIDQGGPEGNPADAPPAKPAIGGLSRVDVKVRMTEPYTPKPPAGSTDDIRCFLLDWPLDTAGYVTGIDPRPGNRGLVHHLLVGLIGPDDAAAAQVFDAKDTGPGFDCSGGTGNFGDVRILGGSLLGGDNPRGIGSRIEPGSKILLNIHYSTAKATGVDTTEIDMRVDTSAREAKVMLIENPMWLVGNAFHVEAGDPDAVFYYRFIPELFTQRKPVLLEAVTPHMHYFGSKITVRALHKDGTKSCLLEIPHWEFGWEQPYWLDKPVRLEPEDELYIECHFDNSAANQPGGGKPRAFSWGEDNQDMCVAFLQYTELQ